MAACAISTAFGQQASTPLIDQDEFRAQMDRARQNAELARQKAEQMRDEISWKIKEGAMEQSLAFAEDAMRLVEGKLDLNLDLKFGKAGALMALAQEAGAKPIPPIAPMAPMPTPKAMTFAYAGGGSYESGKSALDRRDYERAAEIFDRVIRNPPRGESAQSARVDGAYYWKAYALNKLGKRDEALASLGEIAKQFPQSSWLNDAKALQVEVQQARGQAVSPESQADEDLRLYAINALINSDADRAVPLLENLLSNPKMSPRLKERALFVLAQSRSDKAREIVGRYAKGGSNPDLQLTAVQYLGTYRSKESRQLLAEVYSSVSDVHVKRSVLRSFEMSRDIEHLASIGKSEQNVDLRREAVRQLGNIRDEQAVTTLVAIYGTETDKNIKLEILNSLGNQNAVKPLIDCARKETDPDLKRAAVRRLSEMKSKEALDFMAELLK
jgi:HEAT repeat protein